MNSQLKSMCKETVDINSTSNLGKIASSSVESVERRIDGAASEDFMIYFAIKKLVYSKFRGKPLGLSDIWLFSQPARMCIRNLRMASTALRCVNNK